MQHPESIAPTSRPCAVDATICFIAVRLGISLLSILIMELRGRHWNVRSGPARRGLSIPISGVAVAMLNLLRQPF